MKILLVSSYLPYPLYSGGQVRLYNLIKELSNKHEITLICERRDESDDDLSEVEKICKQVITVPRRKQWSVSNIIKAGFSSQSFLTTGHNLPDMKAKIKDLIAKEGFDLIHVETFYVMQNVPETTIPIVLVEHNIEYKVYERFKLKAPIPLRPLLQLDITKIRKEEKACWKRASKVVAVSKDDAETINAFGINAAVVSNGVDIDKFSFKEHEIAKERKILFIGDYKWIQNQDSVRFIINDIWQRIKEKEDRGNIKLWIVGREIPDSIRSLTDDPDVLFDTESSSLPTEEIFQQAAVLLAPIRVGGGTSYKILESMSCGTPVVTMPLSANALQAKDGEALLVGSDATELAQKIVTLLTDRALYKRISKHSRTFIERNYTWKEIAKVLHDIYIKIV